MGKKYAEKRYIRYKQAVSWCPLQLEFKDLATKIQLTVLFKKKKKVEVYPHVLSYSLL